MKIQKLKTTLSIKQRVTLVVVAALLAVSIPLSSVHADSYDAQIRALQQEQAALQAQAAQFRQQADTLQNQLNALQAEANILQGQIDLNNAKLGQLNEQITQTEKKISNQQKVLGDNLVTIYLDSSVTPLEILASSSSISDYIDQQEYRDTIRSQLQDSITTVKKLKEDLGKQKKDLENVIADQNVRRQALADKQSEQQTLLAQTQGQEAAYQQLAASRNDRIRQLRLEQAAANAKWGGSVSYEPRGGGYPSYWADIPMDSTLDNWLMYNRECVSYTAFRIGASGRYQPTGFGNAIQWPGAARARGIPVDRSPRAGDIAVWPVGYYGHVMYVEAVSNDGSIYISEYNFDWTGRYSERTISRGTWQAQGFEFIHF
ncbi:MAG TPA: CHAP domain-containing protein [Candidatus Saccharimonadales bacterium]|nr:CHAP domain-containing protein [Candidatus Saccharimonadales bacterium]